MLGFRRIAAKLSSLINRRSIEDELAREVASHLALLEEEFERHGMDPQEARLAARRAYGSVDLAKELHRDERYFPWLEALIQDVRQALRSLRKSPGFLAVAMLSLAFGIGVNTAIFTLVNGILLKTLPVPDPHRIVQVSAHLERHQGEYLPLRLPAFSRVREQGSIFSEVIGFYTKRAMLELDGVPLKVDLELVAGPYFSFLGARPALGRLLTEQDIGQPVCVLSYQLWQTHFGGDPQLVGRTIRVDGFPLQVIGVASPDFAGPELQRRFDLWTPALQPEIYRGVVFLGTLARLKPGISTAEANARLQAASPAIENSIPAPDNEAGRVYQIRDASKGFDRWRTTLQTPLLILMGAVVLVLLVACANLANLLLARANERRQEFAVKLSLGIGRWRLVRQLLVETGLLAICGGVMALFVSIALTDFLLDLFNAGTRRETLRVIPDASVLLFTFAACTFTALVAGLYPAWEASRTDVSGGLKTSSPDGLQRGLVRRTLIVVQVAIALALLFGASLFTHSLRKLKVIELGYDIDRVLTVDIGPRPRGKNTRPMTIPDISQILDSVRRLPSVESAAFSWPSVLSGDMMLASFRANGASDPRKPFDPHFLFATPGYFAAMHIPLLRGRDFTEADRQGSQPVAIVNQRLASQVWPGLDPIGKRFYAGETGALEVVGLATNSKYRGVREDVLPIVYLPLYRRPPYVRQGTLQIRCRSSFSQIEREVRNVVRTSALDYQVANVSGLELTRDRLLAQERLLAFLSGLLGALGTGFALIGIYGLISYSVTSRTREIGVRMSIGAQRTDVLWLFLRESAVLLAAGTLAGMPLAMMLATYLKTMLYETSTSDPLSIAATLLLLMAGGLLASLIPGRRATLIEPIQALRHD